MKLTSFTDYSLRVLLYLAAQPGRRATIAEIACAFGVSENHLTKVAHFLGQVGLLTNVRGKGGGLDLARAPAEIVIGDVVRQTEGDVVPAECFGENPGQCCIAPVCRLRGVMQQAIDAFYGVLDGCTLADLAANRQALARALSIEVPLRRAPARSGNARGAPRGN
ncbi:MAG: Rrf2 family transcriptional regulator [Betaproteobacteria bacterium]|jgi:Rrf2 family nitric oxide-sensitive transcriptional repressor|nr:Rrf2 family transcriptional regulator [Betaproteobacteria bacterium]MCC6248625.1 Rrf2 family transcriptional regulator [Rubrivivax sp.]MCL4696378.1 Rrf2 family transcriptional regulator [Burkholderiaceae bacterium]